MPKEIIKFIDIPYVVVRKEKILFDFFLYCNSKEIDVSFMLKVSPTVYDRIELNKRYCLANEPVFQKYDLEGKVIGKPFVTPSNF